MKTMILSSLAATAIALSLATTTALAQAQPRDCAGFDNRAGFFSSIGLADAADFWTSVAAECEASNWAEADRRTVKTGIRTMAEESGYERPERDIVEAAAAASGVELPSRGRGKGKGKGNR